MKNIKMRRFYLLSKRQKQDISSLNRNARYILAVVKLSPASSSSLCQPHTPSVFSFMMYPLSIKRFLFVVHTWLLLLFFYIGKRILRVKSPFHFCLSFLPPYPTKIVPLHSLSLSTFFSHPPTPFLLCLFYSIHVFLTPTRLS